MTKVWTYSVFCVVLINFILISALQLDTILSISFLIPLILTGIRQYLLKRFNITSLSLIFLSEGIKFGLVCLIIFLLFAPLGKENFIYPVIFCVNFLVASVVEYIAFRAN